MKKLMNRLFLSCLKVTELMEKRFHFKLTFTEKMQLKAHKMMCDACTRYEKQSELLEKGIKSHQKNLNGETGVGKLKEKIKVKLAENKN